MSIFQLFDVHTHVQFHAFRDDADAVVQRARDAGVWIINVGTQRDTSLNAVAIAEKYPEGVYATIGLHPIHTEKSFHDAQELGDTETARGFTSRGEKFDFEFYEKLAAHPKVVGIGECGLDYYRLEESTKERQGALFIKQIQLSRQVGKPLMIHCRQAFGDLVEILNSESKILNSPPGVVHFFSGTRDDAKKLLDLGFSFSFGGVITFARDYDDVIKYIPLDRILLETDAPYVAPAPYRGKRNEPAYVIEVARKLAELKQVSLDGVAKRTFENARTIFST